MYIAKRTLVRGRAVIRKEVYPDKVLQIIPDSTNLLPKLTSNPKIHMRDMHHSLVQIKKYQSLAFVENVQSLLHLIATFYKGPFIYHSMREFTGKLVAKSFDWKSLQTISVLYANSEQNNTKKKPEFIKSKHGELVNHIKTNNRAAHDAIELLLDRHMRYGLQLPNLDKMKPIGPFAKMYRKHRTMIEKYFGPNGKFNKSIFYDDVWNDYDKYKGFTDNNEYMARRKHFRRSLGVIRNLRKQWNYSREYFDRRFTYIWDAFHVRREVFIRKYDKPHFVEHTKKRLRTFREKMEKLKVQIKGILTYFSFFRVKRKNDKRWLIINRFSNMMVRKPTWTGSEPLEYKTESKKKTWGSYLFKSKFLYLLLAYKIISWTAKFTIIALFGKKKDEGDTKTLM